MDIRKKFMNVARKMSADFESTKDARHNPGRGSNREDLVSAFLESVLPGKYGIGKGEVVTANNDHSGEMDIIIYDKNKCPKLISDEGHGLFPIETVYCAIQIKTSLNSTELKSAYANIQSLKKLISRTGFTHDNRMGFASGLAAPQIIGIVVAFEASRDLETIANQLGILDQELPDIKHRPDFIVALDSGVVGPNGRLRGEFNSFELPKTFEELYCVRNTKRHTLLRFYMKLLDELNYMRLAPFEIDKYLQMPELLGKFRVKGHDHFVSNKGNSDSHRSLKKINAVGIKKIVEYCARGYLSILATSEISPAASGPF